MRSVATLPHGAGPLSHHDHLACAGRGSSDLARVATQVFATAPDTDALLLCLDAELDWDPDVVFAAELADGRLQLAENRTAYAPLMAGAEVTDQLHEFDAVVDARLAAGFTGLRVVADNTAFLTGSAADADRWLAWEQRTDAWQAQREVTGVCWFDSAQVEPDRLAAAAHRHPLSAGDLEPQWRLVHQRGPDAGRLALSGEVDADQADDLGRALDVERASAPADEWLDLDLAGVGYLHHRALAALTRPERGLRLLHLPAIVERLDQAVRPLTARPRHAVDCCSAPGAGHCRTGHPKMVAAGTITDGLFPGRAGVPCTDRYVAGPPPHIDGQRFAFLPPRADRQPSRGPVRRPRVRRPGRPALWIAREPSGPNRMPPRSMQWATASGARARRGARSPGWTPPATSASRTGRASASRR